MISHFLFADETFIFVKADLKEVLNWKRIFCGFSGASGLEINFNKSNTMFSPNVPQELKNTIVENFGCKESIVGDLYLGLLQMWEGRSPKI